MDTDSSFASRRRDWAHYYTEKRITHQWMQVHLLNGLPVRRVLEIGPYLGVVTALLATAGYEPITLDLEKHADCLGAKDHVCADLRAFDPATLPKADAILCCETLEHVTWEEADIVLEKLAASSIPYLVLSVPYEGTQIGLSFYINRHMVRRRSFFRKFRFLKRFKPESQTDWHAHKWEIGYKGYSVNALRQKLERCGWKPERQEFTDGCRSVFLVCRNAKA